MSRLKISENNSEDVPEEWKKIRPRAWVFTLNNYTEQDMDSIKNWPHKYIVFGEEVGENGTPHLQGYIEFEKQMSLRKLKKLHNAIHWEPRLGTSKQASDYCKKDGKFYEDGKMSRPGERTDLMMIRDMIKEGKTIQEIADDFPSQYILYHKGIEKLYEVYKKDRNQRPEVWWIYGKAGVGKTHYPLEKHGADKCYIKDGTKWWNGYDHQEAIIMDDFNPQEWDFRNLLRLLDKHSYNGETKGGHVKVNSPYIYITCEFPPDHFWKDNTLEQVETRINTIMHKKGENRRSRPKYIEM